MVDRKQFAAARWLRQSEWKVLTDRKIQQFLRMERIDFSRLSTALALSLLIHLTVFGVYQGGRILGIWEQIKMPHWLQRSRAVAEELRRPSEEPPLVFVEVADSAATVEVPPETQYYSDRNSIAASEEASSKDTNIPQVSGTQNEMIRTEDALPENPVPLQPAPLEAEPEPEPEPVVKEEPKSEPGDMVVAKAKDVEPEPKPEPPKKRPRTLKEALAMKRNAKIAGEKMKSKGASRRVALAPSLNVRASTFGVYDRNLILAIQNRWYALLDRRGFANDRSGKVVLSFRLTYDGRVMDMKVIENTVGSTLGLLCQLAVTDPAPYERWPSDMRRKIGADYRDVKFTFYYY